MVVNQGWQLSTVVNGTALDHTPLFNGIIIDKGNG